jgi:hypothetical protein
VTAAASAIVLGTINAGLWTSVEQSAIVKTSVDRYRSEGFLSSGNDHQYRKGFVNRRECGIKQVQRREDTLIVAVLETRVQIGVIGIHISSLGFQRIKPMRKSAGGFGDVLNKEKGFGSRHLSIHIIVYGEWVVVVFALQNNMHQW